MEGRRGGGAAGRPPSPSPFSGQRRPSPGREGSSRSAARPLTGAGGRMRAAVLPPGPGGWVPTSPGPWGESAVATAASPRTPPPFPEPPRAGPGAEAAPSCGGPPAAAPLQAARRGLQSAAGALSAPGLPRPRCCPARGVVKGKRLRGGPAGPTAPQARFCLSRGFGFCFPRRFGSKRRVRGSGFLVPSELSRLRRVAVVRLRGSAVPGLFICSPNVHSRNRPPPTAPLLLAIVCLAYVRHNTPSRFFFPP